MPICNSETGDYNHLPFEGPLMDQPYMTMQILNVIQLNYRKCAEEKLKQKMKKQN